MDQKMMKIMKNTRINVLGTEYLVIVEPVSDDIDGYCDYTNKEIHLSSVNKNNVGDFNWLQRKQLRHEVIHAFLSESGLQCNFQHAEQFGHDETMVDWFAIQYPKIKQVFLQLGIEE